MASLIEGLLWLTFGIAMLYTRLKSPFPKWKPDVLASNGKLVIAGLGGVLIGILMLIREAKPMIIPFIIGD